jgi:hypothetical protein
MSEPVTGAIWKPFLASSLPTRQDFASALWATIAFPEGDFPAASIRELIWGEIGGRCHRRLRCGAFASAREASAFAHPTCRWACAPRTPRWARARNWVGAFPEIRCKTCYIALRLPVSEMLRSFPCAKVRHNAARRACKTRPRKSSGSSSSLHSDTTHGRCSGLKSAGSIGLTSNSFERRLYFEY